MLDIRKESDHKAFKELQEAVRCAMGTNFALAMRDPETKEISIHRRNNQPCQGGELRKYKKTHPEDCTRPDDPRPGDLRHPFPDGIPEAVGVKFNNFNPEFGGISPLFVCDLLDFGPYTRVAEGYELVMSRFTDEVVGLIFPNTDVDSTAFVNMLQFIKTAQFYVWEDMLELGFERYEIANLMYLTNPGQSIRRGSVHPYNYYFSTNLNIKRLVNGEFNDLTGGTFRNRFDYNRPEIQDLFKAQEEEHATNFPKLLSERHKWKSMMTDSDMNITFGHQDDIVQIVRDIIKEELEKCG